jgi:hypothetical protein
MPDQITRFPHKVARKAALKKEENQYQDLSLTTQRHSYLNPNPRSQSAPYSEDVNPWDPWPVMIYSSVQIFVND